MTGQRSGANRFAGWAKAAGKILLAVYFLFALAVIAFRYALLPHADSFREEIAASLSKASGAEVRIERIAPAWKAFYPVIEIDGLEIREPGKEKGLAIEKAEGELSWESIPRLAPVFRRLSLSAPELSVRRTGDAAFVVGGLEVKLDPETDDSPALGWLMEQGRVSIRGASVTYRDERTEGLPELRLANAAFAFAQTLRGWEAGLQGELSADGAAPSPLDLRAEISRSLMHRNSDWKKWEGRLYANVRDLDFPALFRSLSVLPEVKAGSGSLELWAEFARGRATALTADADIRGLAALSGENRFSLSSVRGRAERKTASGETVTSSPDITLCLKEGVCAGPVSFTLTENASDPAKSGLEARAASADLGEITNAVLAAAGENPDFGILRSLAPKGRLSNVAFRLRGPLSAPEDWDVSAEFEKLSIEPVPDKEKDIPGIPGGENLSGRIWANAREGAVQIAAADGAASFPGIFENPRVPFDRLSGTAFWETEPKLRLSFRDIRLANSDMATRADAEWEDTGGAGTIRVAGRVANGRAESVWRYIPVLAGKSVTEWLEQALRGGTAREAVAEWRGPIEAFPYTGKDAAKGLFLITGDYENASLDFLPSGRKDRAGHWRAGEQWPLVEKGRGRLLFHGDRMVITGDGQTNGVPATGVTAEIASMGSASPASDLVIHGRAAGNAQRMIDYTKKSPISGWLGHFLDPAKSDGSSSLELSLQIPFDRPERTLVSGAIGFSGNNVDLGSGIPELMKAGGTLHFTQDDFWGKGLEAEVWGMKGTGDLSQRADGAVVVKAKTHAGPEAARPFIAGNPVMEALLGQAAGETEAEVEVVASGSETAVTVTTDLKGIAVKLPGPLAKRSDEARPSSFVWTALPGNRTDISARYGEAANARAILSSAAGSYRLERAGFAIGEEAKLPEKGLSVLATLRAIPVEPWEEELRPLLDAAGKSGSGAGMASLDPISARVKTKSLIFKARTFSDVTASVKRTGGGSASEAWAIGLSSPNGTGTASYRPEHGKTPALVTADLAHLYVPEEGRRRFGQMLEETPAERLPSMKIRIRKLQVADMNLGDVRLQATAPEPSLARRVWKLDSFSAENPGAKLTASGRWVKGAKENFTELTGSLVSKDGEKLMKSLALPADVVRGAAGTVSLTARWPGSPKEFALGKLEGSVKADIGDGQFLQVEPGVIGRFLSILSMQSLMKRLTLDFKDIVGKGFAFSSIRMSGDIKKGVLVTDDMTVDGSAASILVTGSTDFARQRVDCRILVLPDLHTEAPALALALANPIVGVGSFIAQFALKKPLSYMLATQYTVQGPWDSLTFRKGAPAAPKAGSASP